MKQSLILFIFLSLFSNPCLAVTQSELGSGPPQTRSQNSSMLFTGLDFKNILIDFAVFAGIYAAGKKLPKDKRYHLYAGAISGKVASLWCGARSNTSLQTDLKKRKFLCSFGAASVVGVLKEVYDSTGRGNVDFKDAVVTGAGGALIGVSELIK